MSKKDSKNKKDSSKAKKSYGKQIHGHIEGAGIVVEKRLTETLKDNYMPYAMSVIVSRAIPEIDGFKPSHRKILYTMYKMGLLTGNRTKSANIVGQVMKLNPHGDQAIYGTMVRLSSGNETLLHSYVDSKGNFGKGYSRDMEPAASRYTEAKLTKISDELFRDIDKNTVDFEWNYDNTVKEPVLLPVTFPSVLVNSNMGIAVGMASSIPSFNLKEVCDTTIALMKNPEHKISDTLKAPDFAGGGYYIYDKEEREKVYATGRGKFTLRAKYSYDEKNNCIDVREIPASTTAEVIIDRVVDLVKRDAIRGITDIRDETDLSGLKITIDLKRGVDEKKLIPRLLHSTPLESNFSCNFNILINGHPKVLGVKEILNEWISFRQICVENRVNFDLAKNKEKLHLLKGLEKILLNLDKAVKIVKDTEKDAKVLPNLQKAFKIDKIQAEYVAEIKLRNFNKEYILRRIKDVEVLENEIKKLEYILKEKTRINEIIITELKEVTKKYGEKRKTEIIHIDESIEIDLVEEIPDYNIHLFMTEEGYFKKITPASWSASGGHKLKEGDKVSHHIEDIANTIEIVFFTNQNRAYKAFAHEFENSRANLMGDYLPAVLEMKPGEIPIAMIATYDFEGDLMVFFENGKVSRVKFKDFYTKTNRKRLINAYSSASKAVAVFESKDEKDEFILVTNSDRCLIVSTGEVDEKSSRNTQGMRVLKLRKNKKVIDARRFDEDMVSSTRKFRLSTLPTLGGIVKEGDLKFFK